jgi:NhaP-type Na+/H+ or K+/H+ antiporter
VPWSTVSYVVNDTAMEMLDAVQGVLVCTVGGARGALCLIMVQTVVLDIGVDGVGGMSETLNAVKSSLALWTAGVVLCTLLINAPALGFVLRVTGLTKVSLLTLQSRDKARQQFLKFTNDCIRDLQADEDELLQVMRNIYLTNLRSMMLF